MAAKVKTVDTPQTGNLGNGTDSTTTTTTAPAVDVVTVPAVETVPAVDVVTVPAVDVVTVPAVDSAKAIHKALVDTLKSAGIDFKGLYSEWLVDPDESIAMLDILVAKAKRGKVGITDEFKTATLAAFEAAKAANEKSLKVIKTPSVETVADWAIACGINNAIMSQYHAALDVFNTTWSPVLDVAHNDMTEARHAVEAAGFFTDTNGAIVTEKPGTKKTGKTNSEQHSNAGTSRMQTGCTIQVGDVSYNGWKDLAKHLVTSVYKGDTPTNYPVNTKILPALVAMDLPVTVYITPTLVNGTKDAALEAWNKSPLCAKLGEYPTLSVVVK